MVGAGVKVDRQDGSESKQNAHEFLLVVGNAADDVEGGATLRHYRAHTNCCDYLPDSVTRVSSYSHKHGATRPSVKLEIP